jgi:hypothetical protein
LGAVGFFVADTNKKNTTQPIPSPLFCKIMAVVMV